jgi:D-alanyl-lipoteichoic acid acyltransferase DltB (MBOAT superfamily)
MSLTSFTYLFFIFGVALLIRYVPRAFHWGILLLSSYYFYYTWNPVLLPVLGAVTLLSFSIPLIQKKTGNKNVLPWVVVLLVPLVYLKWQLWGNTSSPELVYLIGVSFYTFAAISYVVDCNRGLLKPTTHLGQYASFLSFFPNLLAGPIEKFKFLSPQLASLKPLQKHYIEEAILLIMWGWIKKTVVASRITLYTDVAFDSPEISSPMYILGGILLFPAQLYADYTGYFDIAKGSALLLGVRLTNNFDNQIFYLTRRDAWLRWNKTMHAWFRDYFYFPLAKKLKGAKFDQFNKLLTSCLSGVWHGASIGFLSWGFLQWFFGELKVPALFQRYQVLAYTFTYLTGAFATFWFRVSPSNIDVIFSKLSTLSAYNWSIGFDSWPFVKCVLLIILLEVVNRQIKDSLYGYYQQSSPLKQFGILTLFCVLLLSFSLSNDQLFYYFRF